MTLGESNSSRDVPRASRSATTPTIVIDTERKYLLLLTQIRNYKRCRKNIYKINQSSNNTKGNETQHYVRKTDIVNMLNYWIDVMMACTSSNWLGSLSPYYTQTQI